VRRSSSILLMLATHLLATPYALAAPSSFRVVGTPEVSGRGTPQEAVVVPVAYTHQGAADTVHFFVHAAPPRHDTTVVKAGKPVGEVQFTGTAGEAKITVPRQALAELKLAPGSQAALTFWMKRVGHRWGTAGSRAQGTSFAVPNSALRRSPLLRDRWVRSAPARGWRR
jgi:hypothetical protein